MGTVNYLHKEDYYPEITTDELVRELTQKYCKIWWETDTTLPPLGIKHTIYEKRVREKATDRFVKYLFAEIKNPPKKEEEFTAWIDTIKCGLRKFARETIGLSDTYLDILFLEGFSIVTDTFVKEARKFDPHISDADIFQAIRNVWIANSIQLYFKSEVEFSIPVFAYSMIYPYSDNYLDDPNFTFNEKKDFNIRLKRRLAGEPVEAQNHHEQAIYSLVHMVESTWPRAEYPRVYDGMLAIHAGQEKSLFQQKGWMSPYETDIIAISFEKGGTSVLADGYLVNGNLTKAEADFMIGYGIFLQLIDDLQDIKEDMQNGHMTVFSQTAGKWPLDKLVSKLCNFMVRILDEAELEARGVENLRELILISCSMLIVEEVAKNRHLYTREYVKNLEEYSLFRFAYVKKLRKKLKKQYTSIKKQGKGKL